MAKSGERAGLAPISGPQQGPFLVTGGTGFLGVALVRALLAAGHEVRVLARSQEASLQEAGARWFQGSVLDRGLLARACEGVTGIFHLAGRVEHTRRLGFEPFRALHVDGTLAVIEAAASVGARVVYASTCGTVAVSRDPSFVATEDSPYQREITAPWPYYITKIDAEVAAIDKARQLGVELVTMRPSLILGPGDTRLSSSRTLVDFMDRRVPFVPDGGVNVVDVRDLTPCFERAMAHGRPGATYLVGGHNMTLAALFEMMELLTNIPAPRLRVPYRLARGGAALATRVLSAAKRYQPGLDPVLVELAHHHWYLDASAARRDLGFSPRATEETLEDAFTWLRAHRDLLPRA